MGTGRDKRKKSKPKQPGIGAQKTERKTAKNEAKAQQRAAKAAEGGNVVINTGGDDDIDAMLAAMKKLDATMSQVQIEEDCGPPSARSCACLVPHATKKDTLILYGGEHFDGQEDKTYVYGDLFMYDGGKNRWRKVTSPNRPQPASSAQAVVHRNYLYVFGGEVCSPSGRNFKHHRHLWRCDLDSFEWEQLPGKGGPSARSGHRMVLVKNKLLLFGGFYSAAEETRYFNDLWEFSLSELSWQPVGRAGGVGPRPRGGCQVVVHQVFLCGGHGLDIEGQEVRFRCLQAQESNTLFLFGGHCVEVEGKEEREIVYNDLWSLDLATYQWERLKLQGMAPGPRASFNMVAHRQRAILFGGITDQPGKGDRLFSQAHDDLYQFSFERQRWGPLALRPPKKKKQEKQEAAAAEAATPAGAPADAGAGPAAQPAASADIGGAASPADVLRPDMPDFLTRGNLGANSAIHRAATRIQAHYRGHVVRKAFQTYKLGGKLSELLYSPALFGVDLSGKDMPKPRARSNAQMAVSGDMLYLFGGVVEVVLNDITLDDLWCLHENTAGEDAFKNDEWESASDEAEIGPE